MIVNNRNNNLKNCLAIYKILTELENICVKNNKDLSGVLDIKNEVYEEINSIRNIRITR